MDYREKGNFLYPFPSPEKEGKTEKEKGFQKEKIEKKETKKRKNFLRFFPVAPLFLFQNKELKKEEKKEIFFSISLPFPLQSRKR